MSDPEVAESVTQENSPDPQEVFRKNPDLASLDDFQDLQAGSQIQVTRTSPTQIKGFCGNLSVPAGGMPDVPEEIKSAWGGGSYQLKAKQVTANGRWAYCRGAVQVDIAGYPRDAGKEWMNGVWRPIAMPAVAPQMAMVPAAARSGGFAGVEGLMGQFLQTALQGALSNEGGVSIGELPALINAISGLSGQVQQRDSFTDLERTLSLVAKLNETRPEPAPVAESGDLGALAPLIPMLMQKFAGGGQPPATQYQQPPPPPPQFAQYGAQSSEQMWAGMQNQPPPGPHPNPQYAQPPAGPNWTNQARSAQGYGAPPGYPPQAPPVPPAPNRATVPPQPPQAADDQQGEEYEPLTVDDIAHDMSERSEESRMQFLGEICELLGFDRAIAAQLNGGAPAQAPTMPAGPGGFELNLQQPPE